MICRSCLQRASALSRRALPSSQPIYRSFSAARPLRQASVVDAPSSSDASSAAPIDGAAAPEAAQSSSLSSCAAGTVLSGLNYFKGKQDPVALADNEYPAWLWDCLEVQKKASEEAEADAGDEFSKSKKQRRIAAKKQRDLEAKIIASGDLEALAPKIPLQQQSINLPGKADGDVLDALVAVEKREELRKAMRKERKAKIKEANYLKSM